MLVCNPFHQSVRYAIHQGLLIGEVPIQRRRFDFQFLGKTAHRQTLYAYLVQQAQSSGNYCFTLNFHAFPI